MCVPTCWLGACQGLTPSFLATLQLRALYAPNGEKRSALEAQGVAALLALHPRPQGKKDPAKPNRGIQGEAQIVLEFCVLDTIVSISYIFYKDHT